METNENDNEYKRIGELSPKKEDELYKTDEKEEEDIVTAYSGEDNFLRVAHSFFSAADNLAKNKNKVIDNSWIYPVVYMYGHYMELTLKEMIRLGSCYEENEGHPNPSDLNKHKLEGEYTGRNGHDLEFLWKNAKDYMFKMYSEGFNEVENELAAIEYCISQLKDLYGGTGTKFRYPDKLEMDLDINIEELRKTMIKINSTFGGYFLGLHNKIFN